MAKKQVTRQAPQQVNPGKDRKTKILWIVMSLLLLMFFALPTVLLLFIGLLPTLAAFLIDRTREKYSAFCVAGMNFTGVFPYLLDLWGGNNSVNGVIELLTVFSLVVMYGLAGLGTAMSVLIPPVVASFLEIMAQRRVVQLRGEQKTLLKEWGEEIALNGTTAQALEEGDEKKEKSAKKDSA